MKPSKDILDQLPAIPGDAQGPIFEQPWQATIFALTLELHQRGHFTWSEWSSRLAGEISLARESGSPDLGDTYYQHWLNAFEKLLTDKNLTTPQLVTERKTAWRNAYLNTPHGQPIALKLVHDPTSILSIL